MGRLGAPRLWQGSHSLQGKGSVHADTTWDGRRRPAEMDGCMAAAMRAKDALTFGFALALVAWITRPQVLAGGYMTVGGGCVTGTSGSHTGRDVRLMGCTAVIRTVLRYRT